MQPDTQRRRSPWIIAAVAIGAFLLASWAALAAAVAYTGVITVRIQDRSEGARIFVPVPGAAIEAAAAVVPRVAVERRHGGRWHGEHPDLAAWRPFLAAAARGLEECPDAVLVEVEDGGSRVRVEKRGRALEVHVREDEAAVDVSIPLRTMRRTARRLVG